MRSCLFKPSPLRTPASLCARPIENERPGVVRPCRQAALNVCKASLGAQGLAQRDAEERKGTDLKIVSYAADSVFQVLGAKINKQAEAKVLKFELGKELLPVNRKHRLNGLQLYNDAAFYDEISPVPLFKFDSVVNDWDRRLLCYFEMLFLKFVGQDDLVDVFK